MEVGWNAEKGEITLDSGKSVVASINDINYKIDGNLHQVKIELDKCREYKIMRVANPDRIVVDFPIRSFQMPTQTLVWAVSL